LTLVPLIILCFWIGIYPKPLFRVLERPVQLIVEQVNPGYYGAERASAPAAAAPAPGATTNSMPGMVVPPNETPGDDAGPHSLDPNAKENDTAMPRHPGTEKK
jgi:hypothetical protein